VTKFSMNSTMAFDSVLSKYIGKLKFKLSPTFTCALIVAIEFD
jgi:hypothetical protein